MSRNRLTATFTGSAAAVVTFMILATPVWATTLTPIGGPRSSFPSAAESDDGAAVLLAGSAGGTAPTLDLDINGTTTQLAKRPKAFAVSPNGAWAAWSEGPCNGTTFVNTRLYVVSTAAPQSPQLVALPAHYKTADINSLYVSSAGHLTALVSNDDGRDVCTGNSLPDSGDDPYTAAAVLSGSTSLKVIARSPPDGVSNITGMSISGGDRMLLCTRGVISIEPGTPLEIDRYKQTEAGGCAASATGPVYLLTHKASGPPAARSDRYRLLELGTSRSVQLGTLPNLSAGLLIPQDDGLSLTNPSESIEYGATSPSGNAVLAEENEGVGPLAYHNPTLYVWTPSTAKLRTIEAPKGLGHTHLIPEWVTGSEVVVYATPPAEGTRVDVLLLNPETGRWDKPQRLGSSPYVCALPDGRVLLSATGTTTNRVYISSPAGFHPINLSGLSQEGGFSAFACPASGPDLVVETNNGSLYSASLDQIDGMAWTVAPKSTAGTSTDS